MSPTICHNNENSLESEEKCENNNKKIELNNNVILQKENERKEPKGRLNIFFCVKQHLDR